MFSFRITIAGIQFVGLFASQEAAAAEAERLYPHAWPAQVMRCGARA